MLSGGVRGEIGWWRLLDDKDIMKVCRRAGPVALFRQ